MTELRRALPFLLLPLVLLLGGCGLLPAPFASEPPGGAVAADIAARREQWRAQGVASYEWRVAFSCECVLSGPTTITVVDGVATEITNPVIEVEPGDVAGFPLTVEALFEDALRTLADGGSVDATWDAATGLPRNMFLDRDRNAIDDELSVELVAFQASG